MRGVWSTVGLLGSILLPSLVGADVTGSFDGTVTGKKVPQQAQGVALVLSQTGKQVSGTLALPAGLATFGGAYFVNGTATPKKLKLSGLGPGLARFVWRGKIVGETVRGKATLKGSGAKVVGVLTMTRNPLTAGATGCDAVFTQNRTFFVDQVIGDALLSCRTCHAPGLQAAATRLHVSPGDPLVTARAIAAQIDAANPSASRILQKPLNLVPHGGGSQLVAGSPQEQELRRWVDLIAQAHCN